MDSDIAKVQRDSFNQRYRKVDHLAGNPGLPGSERTLARWINTDAVRVPAPYRFGTAGRSILIGPGLANVDASFIKSWTPAFGIINSARPACSSQLAARIEF